MRFLPFLLFFMLVVSCGPIVTTTAISRAEEERRTALAIDAHIWSPYEFTKGDLLLSFAKDKQGSSDFTNARQLAEEAQSLFKEAKRKVSENRVRRRLFETLYKQEKAQ